MWISKDFVNLILRRIDNLEKRVKTLEQSEEGNFLKEMDDEIDETIKSVCKKVRTNEFGVCESDKYADTVEALASLVEARTKMDSDADKIVKKINEETKKTGVSPLII